MQGLQALAPDSPGTDRMRVAEALGQVDEKQAALNLWKAVLKPDRADPFVFTALDQARECEDDDFIMTFCERLRAAGICHPFTMELEVMTRERYCMFDQAIAIMQAFLAAPTHENLARVFRVRLSLLGKRLSRPELVETDTAKLPPVETTPAKIGAAVAYILRNGPCPLDGVRYAYELVRRHYDDPTARQAYVGIMGIGDDGLDLFPVPSAVVLGCAVQYKIDGTGEEKWIIIEDGANPRLEHEEIGSEHQWAVDMAGKGIGGQFYLRRDPIQSRTATIQNITSKYVYRKTEVMNTWEDRFPDIFFVRKYTFPTKEDGSPDIAPILKALDIKEERIAQMHALYRENPISVASFAALSGAGVLESLSHLASEGSLTVRCCTGTAEEMSQAQKALADAKTFVIDPSALATLFFSGLYECLQCVPGKCVLCESALEEYFELQRKFASPSQGFAGKFKGKYLFQHDDPVERKRQEERLVTFLAKILPLVTLRPGGSLAKWNAELRKEMVGLFGRPTAESIAEAAANGAVLWTDDIGVAELARERAGVDKRVWTQLVFWSSSDTDTKTDLTLFLLQWRYFFTRVEPDVVLAACRRASWNPEAPPLKQVVEWLSAPELNHVGATQVCVHSLQLVWKHGQDIDQQENATRALVRAILARDGGRQTVIFIATNLSLVFAEDKVARSSCELLIKDVLREGMKPPNEESQAAWTPVIRSLSKKWGVSDELVPVQKGQQKGGADGGSDLTPKQRADRRKADRKRNKSVEKKKGKRKGSS